MVNKEMIEESNKSYKIFLASFSPKIYFAIIKLAYSQKMLSVLNYICIPIFLPIMLVCWTCMFIAKTISWLCSILTSTFPLFIPLIIVVIAFEILHFPFRLICTLCVLVTLPEEMTESTNSWL